MAENVDLAKTFAEIGGTVLPRYADGERELYDLRTDPFELHNVASELPASKLALLHAEAAQVESCHDGAACWTAMHLSLSATAPSAPPRVTLH
jgi:hypothetical protein